MTLSQIEASIDELDLSDQLRLLRHLTPRITDAVLQSTPTGSTCRPAGDVDEAVRRLGAAGEKLAATSVPGASSIVEELTRSRR